MFSSSVVILALANAAAVLAQASAGFDVLTSPPQGSSYKAGDVLPIVWTAGKSTGTVSLELIGGAAANALNPILSIASGVTSQSGGYNWTIAGAVGSFATYGINLTSDADPNTFEYSFAFHITGGGSSGSSSASIVSSSSTSPASSSTSASEPTTTVAESTSTVTTSVPSSTATAISTVIMSSSTGSGSESGSKTTTSSTSSVTGTTASNSTVTKASATGTPSASATATGAAGMKVVSGLTAVVAGLVFAVGL